MTRYAMITGASSGLGLALAEALARRGRNLILVARHRETLEPVAIELTQRFGVEVLFRACDLSQPLRLSGFVLELEEGERHIDLLVNCAGQRTYGPFLAHEWADEQDLLEVNVLALSRLCHAIGNLMALHGGGQILNVAALASAAPGPWMATYAASKAYVVSFSEALREELKRTGIKVSVLCPGPVRSSRRRIPRLDDSARCLSPEEVALYTVRALDKNRALIMPGRRNRWLAAMPRLMPRWLTRKLAGVIHRRYCPVGVE
ncbi:MULTISPECIES: SDR family NAD(P)-dependent oxidoreductase [Pseudomonas]|uniref:NAD(P)-dependent oxidoreductase n=2 Tax=Pseudomonas TaxID=286 RepID=A0AAX0W1U0_9PSED|nr:MULTISPECIES: SDR family oxidoreductase [Pseudomonas]MBH3357148.1 SDR family oxidoreductase [Pseudomonas guariconensis]MCO7620611.1 SDR family oxidoreductase [Pseudomonas guariconensis]MDM9596114.1 SDR family oxidoreductase [Pseudomonas guariconensis]MDM9608944.1 SDR family oxidoreductase [Pseudomonas guariconensis]MDM9613901.1 SDR family oxidoreductase [Pseudomonas guariconensis]